MKMRAAVVLERGKPIQTEEVELADPREAEVRVKLEYARQLGASHLVNATEVDPVEAIREITRRGADFTLEETDTAYNALAGGELARGLIVN